MIVGTTHIDYNKINDYVGHPNEFCDWVISLVPCWAKHIKGIVDNQRYYVAIHLRNVISIPYTKRKEMLDTLVKGIRLHGTMTTFVSITDIVDTCDKDLLIQALLSCEEFK